MATSNSTSYTQTRDQIITDALQLIGRLGEGESANTNDLSTCSSFLNKLVKHWETNLHLWLTSEATIFLREGVNKYTLSSSGDKATDDATLVETTLVSGSSTAITVDDSTGMTVGDNIGIELDDGTRQWTTISAIVGNDLTLNAALTSAASEGNTVFSYTTILGRPLAILDARVRTDDMDNGMTIYTRKEYMDIVNKSNSGRPIVLYYTPQINAGILYVWPTPDAVATRLKVSYMRSIQDFVVGTDNADLPQEWLLAITYNLAVLVAPEYGVDLTKTCRLVPTMAARYLEDLDSWDSESGSIFLGPGAN
jgi:hypothetical protein